MPRESAFRSAVVDGKFELFRRRAVGGRPDIPGAGAYFYGYKLVNRETQAELLWISCMIPSEADYPNLYHMEVVKSRKPGSIVFFPRMVEMVRKNLRSKDPKADVIVWYADPKIAKYFARLGARKRREGFLRFPENLTQRKRRRP